MRAVDQVVDQGAAWESLRRAGSLIEEPLRAAIDRLPEQARRIAGYHFGWSSSSGNAVPQGGKGFRPALALLGAQAVGADPEHGMRAAVAVELAHNFSLLHDDIMDGDRTRRGAPSAWVVYGRAAALLTGDALLVLAMDVLAEGRGPNTTAALHDLSRTLLEAVDGQMADMAFETRSDVQLAECLTMAGNKTAMLIGCACALGPLIAGADPARVEHLRDFGRHLGLAFQLTDDLIGIWGDGAVTGKPVGADIRSRKKSLPVVAALASGTSAARMLTDLYLGTAPLGAEEVTSAVAYIEQTGARDWAEKEVHNRLDEALASLEAAEPESGAAAELVAVSRLVIERKR